FTFTSLFSSCLHEPLDLHSFPTRRSSDLSVSSNTTVSVTAPTASDGGALKVKKGLSVWDAVAILVGVVVGIGIFGFPPLVAQNRSEEHTSELQSRENLVCRLLLEKKKKKD